MALEFPSAPTYLGSMTFTFVDENESPIGDQIRIYQPVGIQLADRVEYENAGLGTIGQAVLEGTLPPTESIKDKDLKNLVLQEIAKKGSARAGQIAQARNRVAPNPNTRALFKQVSLRSFAFAFKFIPTNDGEAKTVLDIIKRFRTELYPEDIVGGAEGSLGYKFPNRVQIEFHYDNNPIPNIPKIAPAYVETFTTNLNPTNAAMLQKGGGSVAFSEIDCNITLTESKTLSQDDIEGGF